MDDFSHNQCQSLPSTEDQNPVDASGKKIDFGRNQSIFWSGRTPTRIYKVVSGCVRSYLRHNKMRRVDLMFYFSGDYFGFELHEVRRLSAEAVIPTQLLAIPMADLLVRSTTDVAVARCLFDITSGELARAQEYIANLHRTADERVAQFLLTIKKQYPQDDIELIMSRRDIADHLNLTIESVARSLTRLHNSRAITVEKWKHVAVKLDRLQRYAHS